MGSPELAIVAEGLAKRYGDTAALDRCDLAVPAGTVHGLLGPNGAGKTTVVRILTTLLRPDGGRAEVAGHDVVRRGARVRARIGLVGQHAAVDEVLSGRQNLVMFGRLHHLGATAVQHRADELLERFELTGTGRKPVGRYSGGMRRRLDLAVSLIHSPAVLFLDEPTTGLDPRGRTEVWESVRALVADGTTVLLTTQYLDEADRLADRISVIDTGRVIAEDSPDGLKSRIGADRIDVVVRRTGDLPAAVAAIGTAVTAVTATTPGASPGAAPDADVDHDSRRISVPVRDRTDALIRLIRTLDEQGIEIEDITLRRPTLDEVFMHLTGHRPDQRTAHEDEAMDEAVDGDGPPAATDLPATGKVTA